ncbi:MAG TPA: VanZ family protein [Candidatus Fermentibacter sp.]|nr:VanZ family protein [Candidatus Fermentibacter sp.]
MRAAARVLLFALAAAVWILSSDPAPDYIPPLFPYQDKLMHFVEFAALGFAISLNRDLFRRSDGAALASGVLWAGLDEIHQSFVPGRDCSTGDFLADCAGLAAGFAAGALGSARAGRRRRLDLMFRERSESGS